MILSKDFHNSRMLITEEDSLEEEQEFPRRKVLIDTEEGEDED